MTRRVNKGVTHWDGCWESHHDCAIVMLAEARAALAKCEADCAAMREALERAYEWRALDGDGISDPVRQQVLAALSVTAGADLMRERRALVEAGVQEGIEEAVACEGRIKTPDAPAIAARVLAEFDKEKP